MKLGRGALVAIYLGMGLLTSARGAAELSPRGVLVIDEFGPDSPFGRRFRQQIHSTLDIEKAAPFVLYSESLDTARFDTSNYKDALKTYFVAKYRDLRIDAIVALGADALELMSRIRTNAWPSASIVFATVGEETNVRSLISSNTTGVVLSRRFQDLADSARLVVPQLARIVLVGDPLERQPLRDRYKEELQQVAKHLQITDLTGLSLRDVETRVANLPSDSAIVYLPIYNDSSAIIHDPTEAFKAVAKVANRPIIVDSQTFVGIGATGGVFPSTEYLGREAAFKVARVLNGESASSIPVTVDAAEKQVFDWRQLKRWSVSEATLPPSSEIQYRELSAWDLYRWQIVAIAIVILAQGIVIAWLVYEHRRRRGAEIESHQHLLEVTKLDRALTASALSSSISHELKQPLGAILSNAEAVEMLLDADTLDRDQLKEIVADIRADDHRAVEVLKHLGALLKQSELEAQDIELVDAVNDAVKILAPQARTKGVALEVEAAPSNLRVRADPVHLQQVLLNLGLNAFDAMQDGVPQQRRLVLRVTRGDHHAMVSVEDTGNGIPEDKIKRIFNPFVTTKKEGTGLGLSIVRTIIEMYGGRIWAENRAEGGAAFHFILPLAQA